MNVIPGWDGPLPRHGRDQMCYRRIAGQRPGQSLEERDKELLNQGILPKRMFIKVEGTHFSGGFLVMPDIGELIQSRREHKEPPKLELPWEIVRESGGWMRYDLDLAVEKGDIVIEYGDRKLTRRGPGIPINENISSIEEMAAWLDRQAQI